MKHVSYILKACFSFENNDNMVVSNDIWKKQAFMAKCQNCGISILKFLEEWS